MPQQLADNRQTESTTGSEAGIGVPQIVKANTIETGAIGIPQQHIGRPGRLPHRRVPPGFEQAGPAVAK
jgi:hypothetical protein